MAPPMFVPLGSRVLLMTLTLPSFKRFYLTTVNIFDFLRVFVADLLVMSPLAYLLS